MVFAASVSAGFGQSIAVTPLSFDHDLRPLQLQGKIPASYSLTIRPLSPGDRFIPDSLYGLLAVANQQKPEDPTVRFLGKWGRASLMPITLLSKFASHHPHGWSDGALLPAKGLQSLLSAGAYAAVGPLSVQLRPEWVYAANPAYETTGSFGASSPQKKYTRFFPGQSRVALSAGPLSLALSSENLWWGPGQFTSLIMSNNAAGFNHLSFNTRRPIKTPIGSFEWQVVAGRLEDELNQSEEGGQLKTNTELFGNNVRLNWKYLNAVAFSFSPSFVKGVTVGLTRSFMTDGTNIENNAFGENSFVKSYLPIFDKIFKSKLVDEDQRPWNQLASVYMRLLFPKAHAEAYFDYGWNDHKFNIRDFMMSPFHSAAYIAGAKKMVDLGDERWLDLSAEVNQMQESPDYLVRGAGSWYRHGQNSNYAHYGQVLGSGIGYGSNAITISGVLRRGFNQFGLVFEKIQKSPGDFSSRWSDYAVGFTGRYNLQPLLLTYRLSGVQSNNYGWVEGKDRFNVVGMLSLQYCW